MTRDIRSSESSVTRSSASVPRSRTHRRRRCRAIRRPRAARRAARPPSSRVLSCRASFCGAERVVDAPAPRAQQAGHAHRIGRVELRLRTPPRNRASGADRRHQVPVSEQLTEHHVAHAEPERREIDAAERRADCRSVRRRRSRGVHPWRRTARTRCRCSTRVRARWRDRDDPVADAERIEALEISFDAPRTRVSAPACFTFAANASAVSRRLGEIEAALAMSGAATPPSRAGPRARSRGCRAILSSAAYTAANCDSAKPLPSSSAFSSRRSDTRATHIARRQPELLHDLDRDREQLGVGGHVRLADDVHVQLEVLAQTAALLPLVAEQLRDREPAHRLPQRVRPLGDHARERRRHLGPQRDLAVALVREVVQLPRDLVAALLRVEIERLQRRPVVLHEREPPRDLTPGRERCARSANSSG